MNKKAYGFTIVELLIVIVVIGILAAISVVAYNGITKRTTEVKIKTELSQVGKALQVDKAESDEYPDYLWATNDIDNIINQEDEQTYGYYQRDGGAGFCVDVISTKYRDLRFHLSNDSGSVQPGLCEENDNIPNSERFVLENCFLFDKVEGAIIGYGWSRANVDDDENFFPPGGIMGDVPDGWEIGTSCPMDVVIPSSIQGVSVVAIDGFCTQNECAGMADGSSQLTSVVIPDTVRYIGYNAFNRNALQSVIIPRSVTHLDAYAFYENDSIVCHIPFDTVVNYDGNARCNSVIRY